MITCDAWRGRRYAVLGLARSGAATVRALVASGAEVTAWDADEERRSQFLPGTSASIKAGPLHQAASRLGPPPRAGEE